MSSWIKLMTGYRHHPKTLRLRKEMGPGAQWYPVALWLYCADSCLSGEVGDDLIENVCGWSGKPGRLLAALKACGFVDDGGRAHDFREWSGADLQRIDDRRRADRARKSGGIPAEHPQHPPQTFQRNSSGIPAEFQKTSGGIPADRARAGRGDGEETERRGDKDSSGDPSGRPVGPDPVGDVENPAKPAPKAKPIPRTDDTLWREHVPEPVQQLIDTLRREVSKHSPEACWEKPTAQEAISGKRMVRRCSEGGIPGVPKERQTDRLLFVLHLVPGSSFWRGKVFSLVTVEKNLSQMLEQTRRDWDTLKDHPEEWGGLPA